MAKVNYLRGFKIIGKYLKPHRRDVFVLFFLSIASSFSGAILPYLVGRILDVIRSGQTTILFNFTLPTVMAIVVFWFISRLVSDLADWRMDVRNERLAAILEGEFVVNGFGKLFELPISFHRSRKVGEVANRISRAAGWLYSIVNYTIINLAPSLISIIIGLGIVFYFKPLFGFIFIFALALYTLVIIQGTPKLTDIQERMHKAYNKAYGEAYDAIANIQPIKQAAAEKFEHNKLHKVFQLKAIKFYNEYIAVWQALTITQKILMAFTQAAVFLISYYLIQKDQMTIGQMAMFISYSGMIFGPFMSLGRNWQTIQNGFVAIGRAEKVLTLPSEPYVVSGSLIPKSMRGDVEFNDVFFSYESKNSVLKGISFKAESGESVALVGESGVGKTTIVDLLARFFEPQKGKILIDGNEISKLDLSFLRKNIAYVPQEVVLFNDTVKNNIKYGKFEASDKEVEEAARLAHAEEFIKDFPKKYNQIVGERGVKLSVGQKQRVAIARAILRNPRILVLDEPTSALDAESEKYVTEALEKLMKDKTTFIIAHRLSTVRKADKIIVLDKGRVVEIGRHDELIQKSNGIYKKLYELQFGLK